MVKEMKLARPLLAASFTNRFSSNSVQTLPVSCFFTHCLLQMFLDKFQHQIMSSNTGTFLRLHNTWTIIVVRAINVSKLKQQDAIYLFVIEVRLFWEQCSLKLRESSGILVLVYYQNCPICMFFSLPLFALDIFF